MIKNDAIKYKLQIIILLIILFSYSGSNRSYANGNQFDVNTDRSLSFPKNTINGTLKNGLRYIILKNNFPLRKIQFNLFLSKGSIDELPNETGAAHFVEHMAFVDTEDFPSNSIISFLESKGMRYGKDINAYTNFDRTVYYFSVRYDDNNQSKMEDSSLLILKNWISGIKFPTKQVNREKKVILEERRGYKEIDPFFDAKTDGSAFEGKTPIGKESDIKKLNTRQLLSFYKRNYQPRNATLIIVGDLNPEEMAKKIKRFFSKIKNNPIKNNEERTLRSFSRNRLSSISSSSYKSDPKLQILFSLPIYKGNQMRNIFENQKYYFLEKLLVKRFSKLNKNIFVSSSILLDRIRLLSFSLKSNSENQLLNSVYETALEINRILRFGFHNNEFKKIMEEIIDEGKSVSSSNKSSSDWCDYFITYMIGTDTEIVNTQDKKTLIEYTKQLKKKEIEKFLKSIVQSPYLVTLEKNNKDSLLNNISLKSIENSWKKGISVQTKDTIIYKKENIHHQKKSYSTDFLFQIPEQESEHFISNEKYYSNTDIYEIKLKNGFKIILKPMPKSFGKVMINLIGAGGTLSIPTDRYPYLENSVAYMEMGGLKKLKREQLFDFMYNRNWTMNVNIGAEIHGITCSTPPKDVIPILNLIYQKIQNPEIPVKDFFEEKKRMLKNFGKKRNHDLTDMLMQDPSYLINREVVRLLGNPFGSSKELKTKEEIEKLSIYDMADFYKNLFTDTESSHIEIVGNFNLKQVKEACINIFGKFKQHRFANRQSISQKYNYPDTIQTKKFILNGIQDFISINFHGAYNPSLKNSLLLKITRSILEKYIIKRLRFDEGIVYSVMVSLNHAIAPISLYNFEIRCAVDPKNIDKLERELIKIIKELQKIGTSEIILNEIKHSFLSTKKETLNQKDTSEWIKAFQMNFEKGILYADFDQYEIILNSINLNDINHSIKTLINLDRYLKIKINGK